MHSERSTWQSGKSTKTEAKVALRRSVRLPAYAQGEHIYTLDIKLTRSAALLLLLLLCALADVAKVIRDINDTESLWEPNDFGPYVKAQFELAVGTEGQKVPIGTVGTVEQFLVWYAGFEASVAAMLAQREAGQAEKEAKAAAKAGGTSAGAPNFSGDVWEVPMSKYQVALLQAWNEGKTPLAIDCSTPEGDDKGAGFSPLEVFYSYSGEGCAQSCSHTPAPTPTDRAAAAKPVSSASIASPSICFPRYASLDMLPLICFP